jgi:hypothetical protein
VGEVVALQAPDADDERQDRPPPSITARVDNIERWKSGDNWGDLGALGLTSVLNLAARGDVSQWAELVEYAIGTDETLASLYATRIMRVAQAEYVVKPSPFGDQRLAQLAAEFTNEQMARIENLDQAIRLLLHAVAVGFSPAEMAWERDAAAKLWYVKRVLWRHPRRFKYGTNWDLRLYDYGRRAGADKHGEVLDPRKWIVHEHQEVAGYPGSGGIMRAGIWTWMFTRWVRKFHIAHLERYGSPFIYGTVKKGTPASVRTEFLDNLQNLSADHVAVFEEMGSTSPVTVEAAASIAGSSQHESYLNKAEAGLAKLWLGASDAVDPGAHGSQAAVGSRATIAVDPRMVADAKNLWATWRRSYVRNLISLNTHKFGVSEDQIPLPMVTAKVNDDKVGDDTSTEGQGGPAAAKSERVPEVGGEIDIAGIVSGRVQPQASSAPSITPQAQPAEDVQKTALNGAQVSSLLEVITSVVNGQVPRESAVAIIQAAFNQPREVAESMLGDIGRGFAPEPTAAPVAAELSQQRSMSEDPKAGAAARPRQTRRKAKTQPTGKQCLSPLAEALRGKSGA